MAEATEKTANPDQPDFSELLKQIQNLRSQLGKVESLARTIRENLERTTQTTN